MALQSVVKSFNDVDLIVHAGDVGKPEVLETLQAIARVYPVRGNVDGGKLNQSGNCNERSSTDFF